MAENSKGYKSGRLFRFGGVSGFGLLFDGEFLVNGVRGRRCDGLSFFEHDDVRVVVIFVSGAALDNAVCDDGEDPEHTEENTNSASQDKRDRATLPETEVHEGEVEAGDEGPAVLAVMGAAVMGPAVGSTAARTTMAGAVVVGVGSCEPEIGDGLVGDKAVYFIRVDGQGHGDTRGSGWRLEILNEREAKCFAESIRDFDALLAEAPHGLAWSAHATRATRWHHHLGHGRINCMAESRAWKLLGAAGYHYHTNRHRGDLGNSSRSENSSKC
jgi:hypothetical protein